MRLVRNRSVQTVISVPRLELGDCVQVSPWGHRFVSSGISRLSAVHGECESDDPLTGSVIASRGHQEDLSDRP